MHCFQFFCSLVFFLLATNCAKAGLVIDDFENQSNSSGDGTPLHYFSFGVQLSDRGVGAEFAAAPSNFGAFYVIDFDIDEIDSFGVGAARTGLLLQLNSSDSIMIDIKVVSGNVQSSFVAFRIADADGTVMRTDDNQLFSIGNKYQSIGQSIHALSMMDFAGTVNGLDLSNITSVGLLFFDRGFTGRTTIAFDNLQIVPVPESSLLACLGLLSGALMWHRKSRDADGLTAQRMPPRSDPSAEVNNR